MLVWFVIRKKMNETNQRTKIVLAAIEKNPEMDIEEIMKKISFGIFLGENQLGGTDDPLTAICFGLLSLGVGIAFLVNYFVGKKMLAKEMEAEEKSVTEQV